MLRPLSGFLFSLTLALAGCAAPADDAESTSSATSDLDVRDVCGATPYRWLRSPSLGDVLERQELEEHGWLELKAKLLVADIAGAGMKTRRTAKYSTKSELVRYETQDRGKRVDATMLVSYPSEHKSRTYPILLVLHGTAGFNDSCAPSKKADPIFGAMLASLGYIVVAPDYIGLKSLGAPTGFLHPYLVAEPTAIASLDAVRSAKKLFEGSSSVKAGPVVVVGGSQGGHAAAFVNRYAPHYAPELDIRGSVWDVPPTNLVGQSVSAVSEMKNATKNLAALSTTFESWYGASPNGVAAVFRPPFDTQFPALLATPGTCKSGGFPDGTTITDLFTPRVIDAARNGFTSDDALSCYLRENSLQTTSVPKRDAIPSLFLLAENDELVDNAVERASFDTLCQQGHRLQYLECQGASHTKPLSFAFDQWLDFLEDRLANKPMGNVCERKPAERCTSMR